MPAIEVFAALCSRGADILWDSITKWYLFPYLWIFIGICAVKKRRQERDGVGEISRKQITIVFSHEKCSTHHTAPSPDSGVGCQRVSPTASIASGQVACILRRISAADVAVMNSMGSPVKGSINEDVCAATKDASPSRIATATDMIRGRSGLFMFLLLLLLLPLSNHH